MSVMDYTTDIEEEGGRHSRKDRKLSTEPPETQLESDSESDSRISDNNCQQCTGYHHNRKVSTVTEYLVMMGLKFPSFTQTRELFLLSRHFLPNIDGKPCEITQHRRDRHGDVYVTSLKQMFKDIDRTQPVCVVQDFAMDWYFCRNPGCQPCFIDMVRAVNPEFLSMCSTCHKIVDITIEPHTILQQRNISGFVDPNGTGFCSGCGPSSIPSYVKRSRHYIEDQSKYFKMSAKAHYDKWMRKGIKAEKTVQPWYAIFMTIVVYIFMAANLMTGGVMLATGSMTYGAAMIMCSMVSGLCYRPIYYLSIWGVSHLFRKNPTIAKIGTYAVIALLAFTTIFLYRKVTTYFSRPRKQALGAAAFIKRCIEVVLSILGAASFTLPFVGVDTAGLIPGIDRTTSRLNHMATKLNGNTKQEIIQMAMALPITIYFVMGKLTAQSISPYCLDKKFRKTLHSDLRTKFSLGGVNGRWKDSYYLFRDDTNKFEMVGFISDFKELAQYNVIIVTEDVADNETLLKIKAAQGIFNFPVKINQQVKNLDFEKYALTHSSDSEEEFRVNNDIMKFVKSIDFSGFSYKYLDNETYGHLVNQVRRAYKVSNKLLLRQQIEWMQKSLLILEKRTTKQKEMDLITNYPFFLKKEFDLQKLALDVQNFKKVRLQGVGSSTSLLSTYEQRVEQENQNLTRNKWSELDTPGQDNLSFCGNLMSFFKKHRFSLTIGIAGIIISLTILYRVLKKKEPRSAANSQIHDRLDNVREMTTLEATALYAQIPMDYAASVVPLRNDKNNIHGAMTKIKTRKGTFWITPKHVISSIDVYVVVNGKNQRVNSLFNTMPDHSDLSIADADQIPIQGIKALAISERPPESGMLYAILLDPATGQPSFGSSTYVQDGAEINHYLTTLNHNCGAPYIDAHTLKVIGIHQFSKGTLKTINGGVALYDPYFSRALGCVEAGDSDDEDEKPIKMPRQRPNNPGIGNKPNSVQKGAGRKGQTRSQKGGFVLPAEMTEKDDTRGRDTVPYKAPIVPGIGFETISQKEKNSMSIEESTLAMQMYVKAKQMVDSNPDIRGFARAKEVYVQSLKNLINKDYPDAKYAIDIDKNYVRIFDTNDFKDEYQMKATKNQRTHLSHLNNRMLDVSDLGDRDRYEFEERHRELTRKSRDLFNSRGHITVDEMLARRTDISSQWARLYAQLEASDDEVPGLPVVTRKSTCNVLTIPNVSIQQAKEDIKTIRDRFDDDKFKRGKRYHLITKVKGMDFQVEGFKRVHNVSLGDDGSVTFTADRKVFNFIYDPVILMDSGIFTALIVRRQADCTDPYDIFPDVNFCETLIPHRYEYNNLVPIGRIPFMDKVSRAPPLADFLGGTMPRHLNTSTPFFETREPHIVANLRKDATFFPTPKSKDGLLLRIKKYDCKRDFTFLGTEEWYLTRQIISNYYSSQFEPRLISFEDAIIGVNPTASSGFPFNKGKKIEDKLALLYDVVKEKTIDTPAEYVLNTRVLDLIHFCMNHLSFPIYYQESFKEELREWEEIIQGKLRTFTIESMPLYVAHRMCFMSQNPVLFNVGWSRYGMTPFFRGAMDMFKEASLYLNSETEVLCTDIRSMDLRIFFMIDMYWCRTRFGKGRATIERIREIMLKHGTYSRAMLSEIDSAIPDVEDNLYYRWVLYNTICPKVILVNGDVIQVIGINPSGKDQTSYCATFARLFASVYTYVKWYSRVHFSIPHDWTVSCQPLSNRFAGMYGDDNVEVVPKTMTDDIVLSSLTDIGMEIKENTRHVDMYGSKFIGFNFITHWSTGYIVPSYNWNKVATSLLYATKLMDEDTQLSRLTILVLLAYGIGKYEFESAAIAAESAYRFFGYPVPDRRILVDWCNHILFGFESSVNFTGFSKFLPEMEEGGILKLHEEMSKVIVTQQARTRQKRKPKNRKQVVVTEKIVTTQPRRKNRPPRKALAVSNVPVGRSRPMRQNPVFRANKGIAQDANNIYLHQLVDPANAPPVGYPDMISKQTTTLKLRINMAMPFTTAAYDSTPAGTYVAWMFPSVTTPLLALDQLTAAGTDFVDYYAYVAPGTRGTGLPLTSDLGIEPEDDIIIDNNWRNINALIRYSDYPDVLVPMMKGYTLTDGVEHFFGVPGFAAHLSTAANRPTITVTIAGRFNGTTTMNWRFVQTSGILVAGSTAATLNASTINATNIGGDLLAGTTDTGLPGVGLQINFVDSTNPSAMWSVSSVAVVSKIGYSSGTEGAQCLRMKPHQFPDINTIIDNVTNYRTIGTSATITYQGSLLNNGGRASSLYYRGGASPGMEGFWTYDAISQYQNAYSGPLIEGTYSWWSPADVVDMEFKTPKTPLKFYQPYNVMAGMVVDTTQQTPLRIRIDMLIEITSKSQIWALIPSRVNENEIHQAMILIQQLPHDMGNPEHFEKLKEFFRNIGRVAVKVGNFAYDNKDFILPVLKNLGVAAGLLL